LNLQPLASHKLQITHAKGCQRRNALYFKIFQKKLARGFDKLQNPSLDCRIIISLIEKELEI
jgi:hypothetical protein